MIATVNVRTLFFRWAIFSGLIVYSNIIFGQVIYAKNFNQAKTQASNVIVESMQDEQNFRQNNIQNITVKQNQEGKNNKQNKNHRENIQPKSIKKHNPSKLKSIKENKKNNSAVKRTNELSNHNPKHLGLLETKFDLNYFGDVSELPEALHKIDSSIVTKRYIGTKFNKEINIDLQNISIDEVTDALRAQTNDTVDLLYNTVDNSIGLSFHKIIDVGDDAVIESLKWQSGSSPKPVLKADGVVRFPYGEYQPTITCQPLNLCDIELQSGEEIQGIIIGDSLRWNDGDQGVPVVYSGVTPNLTPHLVLKPSMAGLETSLMVTTSKHTYMIKIKSANRGYLARSGFYYPREMIQKFKDNKNKPKPNIAGEIINGSLVNNDTENSTNGFSDNVINSNVNKNIMINGTQTALVNLGKVNYNYTISGDDYTWKPTQVFDDGTSVYIQMPDSIGSRNLPGVCVVIDDDKEKCELVNFRFNNHFYVVDKLFDKANLVNGFGDTAQIVVIERGKKKKGFWSRIFG